MNNLTVIVPFWNGHEYAGRLAASIPERIPIVFVDDLSDRPLRPRQIRRPNVRIVRLENKGYFTGAVNLGVNLVDTDVLVLNQDSQLLGDHALRLIDKNRKRFAMIGERIKGRHPAWPHGYIHGTFMFIRRDAWEAVGDMDARNYPLWGSTCEWQLRACRKGFEVLPLPEIPGFHHVRGDRRYGSAIDQLLKTEEGARRRRLFIRTPPRISVILTSYNYGRFLSDAVNSLIGGKTSLGTMPGQTFQGFEVIIVDDGSTDGTPEIGKMLADSWKGVRYIRRPNGGTAAANNTGIRAANAPIIAVMGGDDMMASDRLALMLRTYERNPGSVVCDGMTLFNGDKYLDDGKGNVRHWNMIPYDFDVLLEKNIMHAGIMFSKEDWKRAGGYPERMANGREDWAFNIALGRVGVCGITAPGHGYLYRRQGHNRTLRNTTPTWRKFFADEMKTLFPELYYGERPMACCGGRRTPAVAKTVNNPSSREATMAIAVNDGMVLIEYTGSNTGDMTFRGPSGTRYRFGGTRKQGYVAQADLQHFLTIFEDGNFQFREVKTQPHSAVVAKVEEEKVAVVEAPPKDEQKPVEPIEPAEFVESIDYRDPTEHTVKTLTAEIESDPPTPQEAAFMLNAEEGGKARKSVIAMLKEFVGE